MRSEKVLQKKLNSLIKQYGQGNTAKLLGYSKAPTITYWKKIGRIPYNGQVAIENYLNKGE